MINRNKVEINQSCFRDLFIYIQIHPSWVEILKFIWLLLSHCGVKTPWDVKYQREYRSPVNPMGEI